MTYDMHNNTTHFNLVFDDCSKRRAPDDIALRTIAQLNCLSITPCYV